MRRRGLCGSGLIAEASAAVSRARVSTICWSISTCHVLGFFAGAVLDYSAGFSLPMPDAETSISEEPGARKGHAGICAGAVRATGRPTAMADAPSTVHIMKFFTREWHAGEVSESEANTIPAAYQADIEGLLSKMPVAVRALAQSINLHDGRIRRVTPRSLEIYSNRRAAMRRHPGGLFRYRSFLRRCRRQR